MQDCIFCKISKKIIPTKFLYLDDEVMAFSDLHPQKPVHILVIPRKHVKEFVEVDDAGLLAKLNVVVQKMIKETGLDSKGYKVVINGGGHQEIDHLHIHLTGPMGSV